MLFFFLCQEKDGIRYLVRSRGLGDVYKRQEVFEVEGGGEVVHDELRIRNYELGIKNQQRTL